ncbi:MULTISPECIES: dynamin family protein [unclassified Coleofasciculus]|uniref:dynamin family protein n=1 Tax=unclassified Coleofasciculus TaxID=2692782 RepID=UPI001882D20C|nr:MULTISPECIES: dynamin family protein [unclassified Coleofasciculus]MBE9129227.1 dynamin family protein [Coleofasciculus sp. LEGE 07081]MBE9151386.1 dynamin family protein [Coleofasciculus sp. LEGE 07092]
MNYTVDSSSFLKDLDRVARIRHQVADHLSQIAQTLNQAELEGEEASGKLALERESEDISIASENLRQGVFRLLVLGDLKRGKSTFLNALIGENLLPSDVNPCTALLTVLRYGAQKKVTVYFKGERPAEQLEFTAFKQKYTIDPTEAKKLEEEKKQAFPDVAYAVVEYPLPLLEKGIEIVDSPGLNDTEARNELSLNYINNCHAILFVFRAMQPCTLAERRYLENYIKSRGLSVFFLINAWDEIRKGLIDPENAEELQEAQDKLRQVFRTNLADYCQVNGHDIYNERVFEVSSLEALRQQLKNPEDSLEGTGFPEFTAALNTFLTQERAVAQLRQARTLARQTYTRIHEAVERRIPLLDRDVEELQSRIRSVEPEFEQLTEIRDRFQDEIRTSRDRQARAIADSFRTYSLNLGNTFDSDFLRYQPDIGFLEFLQKDKRDEFNAAFKQAFEQYINDKIAEWELTAEQQMREAFSQLAKSAANYGATYNQVVDTMTQKLIGQAVHPGMAVDADEDSPAWTKWAMGFFSLASGNVAGVALAAVGFDWKNILVNWLAAIGITSFLAIFTGMFFGPVGIALMGLGVGTLQAEEGRKKFITVTKKEFVKYLPQLAQEQWQSIHQTVKDCFDAYEREVTKRIDDDIKSRKAELENLLEQKKSGEINRETELKRLKALDAEVLSECQKIESEYEGLLSSPA